MSTTALWRTLRTSWWLIALGAVIGALLGAAALMVLPKTYSSSASVLVTAAPVDPASTEDTFEIAQKRLPNVVEMAGSDESRAQVASAAGIEESAVSSAVSYEIPDETTVIEVTGSGDSAESAQAVTDAATETLVARAGDVTMSAEVLEKAGEGGVASPSTPITIATGLLLGALLGLLVSLIRGARRFADDEAAIRTAETAEPHGAHCA